ncbi:hypothetical protein FRC16_001746 [Serendipita sp. 398]|nr:hypothetical protein FRC16_001746 [Serendipita sp. 398]
MSSPGPASEHLGYRPKMISGMSEDIYGAVKRRTRWEISLDHDWIPESWKTSREKVLRFVKKRSSAPRFTQAIPSDPHTTWIGPSVFPFGIQEKEIPVGIDLDTERVGRVIDWTPRCNPEMGATIALFPLCPENPLCPPYPGLPPDSIDDDSSEVSSFTDGTLGKWDPRFYPQLYNTRKPWYSFYMSLLASSDEVSYAATSELVVWARRGNPALGGQFARNIDLYTDRANAEQALIELAEEMERDGINVNEFLDGKDLPWYDDYNPIRATELQEWCSSRDVIARTARYVAEIMAMESWLAALQELLRPQRCPAANRSKSANWKGWMGVWAASIPKDPSVWRLLLAARVPIYMATVVPPHHPFCSLSRSGNLDADERYRINFYERTHRKPNTWWTVPSYTYHTRERPPTVPCPNLPSRLFLPASIPNGYLWTLPMLEDNNIDRYYERPGLPQPLCPAVPRPILEIFRSSLTLAPFSPPEIPSLTQINDPHPFFELSEVYTQRPRSPSRLIHYQEYHDGARDLWWFTRVKSKKQIAAARRLPYQFPYYDCKIIISSDHPFPGRPISFHRWFQNIEEHKCSSNMDRRSYIPSRDHKQKDAYNWVLETPTQPIHPIAVDAPQEYIQVEPEPEPDVVADFLGTKGMITQGERRPSDEEMVEEMVMDEFDFGGVEANAGEENRSVLLANARQEQRRLLEEAQALEPFNLLRSHLSVNELTPWVLNHSSLNPPVVWPVRLYNLIQRYSEFSLCNLLQTHCGVEKEDILLYGHREEANGTYTWDIGLRYPEDALITCAHLHGILVNDEALGVSFLSSIEGRVFTLEPPAPRTPVSSRRLDQCRRLYECRGEWWENAAFQHACAFLRRCVQLDEEVPPGNVVTSIAADPIDTVADSQHGRQLKSKEAELNLPVIEFGSPQWENFFTSPFLEAFQAPKDWALPGSIARATSRDAESMQAERSHPQISKTGETSDMEGEEEEGGDQDEHEHDHGGRPSTRSLKTRKRKASQELSGGKPEFKRKRRYKNKNRDNRAYHPTSTWRLLVHKARDLISTCKTQLPPLPDLLNEVRNEEDILLELQTLWRWMDSCHAVLLQASTVEGSIMHTEGEQYSQPRIAYAPSLVKDIFGVRGKLRGLHGKLYQKAAGLLRSLESSESIVPGA